MLVNILGINIRCFIRRLSLSNVDKFYDAIAENYHEQYSRENLFNAEPYPVNYFRLQIVVNALIARGARRVLEVGVGEGTPLITIARSGMDVCGFDLSPEMVKRAKINAEKSSLNPDDFFWGDVQDPITYTHCLHNGAFDAVLAMGVMPHVENDEFVLGNIASCIKPGGSVYVEFRNKLFSLFTFNRLTMEFIMDDLLKDVSSDLKNAVGKELAPRLRMDLPPVRDKVQGKDGVVQGYDVILSKFHNPFDMEALFKRAGFKEVKIHWYHYHPAMPSLEKPFRDLFRKESMKLEHENSGWRGLFLCSAYVVEAEK